MEQPICFSENFQIPSGKNKTLIFEAKSFQQWVNRCIPQISHLTPEEVIPIGNYELILKPFETTRQKTIRWVGPFPFPIDPPITQRNTLRLFQGVKAAYCGFSDRIFIPVLQNQNKVWMSLTPMEIATCRGGIRKAHGHVLIAGMGLSWIAKSVAQRKQVKTVTIVDINSDLLQFFGNLLQQEAPTKVNLIASDI